MLELCFQAWLCYVDGKEEFLWGAADTDAVLTQEELALGNVALSKPACATQASCSHADGLASSSSRLRLLWHVFSTVLQHLSSSVTPQHTQVPLNPPIWWLVVPGMGGWWKRREFTALYCFWFLQLLWGFHTRRDLRDILQMPHSTVRPHRCITWCARSIMSSHACLVAHGKWGKLRAGKNFIVLGWKPRHKDTLPANLFSVHTSSLRYCCENTHSYQTQHFILSSSAVSRNQNALFFLTL